MASWLTFVPGPLAFADGTRVALAAYPGRVSGPPVELDGADAVTRGRYLAEAADCEACHTVPGAEPLAGGRPFPTPFGTLYSPNITPDPRTGIGAWSDAEFLAAMHRGINRRGRRCIRAFPFAAYALLTDEDVQAIKAYLFTVPAVDRPSRPHELNFPFNRRELMVVWSAIYTPSRRFEPVRERSAAWNRGAYLTEALAHCGDCHTPRNLLQALDNRRKFAGGLAEGWRAYNLTSDPQSGIGTWDAAEVVQYLRSGHAPNRGTAFGPMAEAVHLSLQKLVPSDVDAIVEYVRSVRRSAAPICPRRSWRARPTTPSTPSMRTAAIRKPGAVREPVRGLPRVDGRERLRAARRAHRQPGGQRSERDQRGARPAARRLAAARQRGGRPHAFVRVVDRHSDRGRRQLRDREVRRFAFVHQCARDRRPARRKVNP